MSAEVTRLANGLRIATDRMEGFRTAAVAVFVLAGGRHERKSQNGIAHFLEHMAFKGTRRRTAIQISEEIEHVGGYLNAATGKEVTTYFAGGLGEDVPLAIELIGDIVLNSVMRPEDIDLERGVILNEIGEYEDSPVDSLFDALQRTVYPEQPFGRPIIGTEKLVSSFRRDDLLEFVDAHYAPSRMIITATGDVNHGQVVAQAKELFADMPAGSGHNPQAARFQGGRQHRELRSIEQAHFALAFEAPQILAPAESAARIFAIVLGGGSSSRLFAEARERRGLCYSISAHTAPSSDTGTFTISASTGRNEIGELASLCIDELKKAADSITQAEVDKARNQIRVAVLTGNESPMQRSDRMGAMLAFKGELEEVDETIARYDAVTVDEVRSFAAGLVAGANASMSVLGPVENAPSIEFLMDRLAA